MSELKVPTMSDFISAGSADPLREDMFEKLLDERDMLFAELHSMVLRFGHRVKNERELAVMNRAREALDRINPEWRRENTEA
jgi:hypothetical protein